jgi:hypothetical protein
VKLTEPIEKSTQTIGAITIRKAVQNQKRKCLQWRNLISPRFDWDAFFTDGFTVLGATAKR